MVVKTKLPIKLLFLLSILVVLALTYVAGITKLQLRILTQAILYSYQKSLKYSKSCIYILYCYIYVFQVMKPIKYT